MEKATFSCSSIDPANWMSNLPASVCSKPIKSLVIPGSHDSGAFYLDKNSDIAPNEGKFIKFLAKIFGSLAKNVIYKWSITQDLSLSEQLEKGVRYLDLRVAYQPKTKDFRVVHGLFGLPYTQLFASISEFLDKHPKEVVILDFNHLIDFTTELSSLFAAQLMKSLGEKLYARGKLGLESSLNDIWGAKKQVIAIYWDAEKVKTNPLFWPGVDICSPWFNTTSISTLLADLNKRFDDLKSGAFNVFQAILTPSTGTILLHLLKGSLKKTLAENCDNNVSPWLDEVRKEKKKGVNILISDFVGYNDIVNQMIVMNFET